MAIAPSATNSTLVATSTGSSPSWRTQFLPLLNYYKLTGLVDGSDRMPPAVLSTTADPLVRIPNPACETWRQRDQLLLSWIISSLSETTFTHIIGKAIAFDAWTSLASAYGSISPSRQLHIELQSLRRNDMSVTDYLQQAKTLADELGAAGRDVSDAEFNAIVYRNIGAEFHGIISAIAQRSTPVTCHELHGQLLAHEILIRNSYELPIANVAAAPNQRSFPLRSGSNSQSRNHGHRQQLSPPRQGNINARYSSRRPSGPCQICGYRNHTADRCRRRYQQPPAPTHNS